MYSYDELASESLELLDELSPPHAGPEDGDKPTASERQPTAEAEPCKAQPPLPEQASSKPCPPEQPASPDPAPPDSSQPQVPEPAARPFHRDYYSLLKTHRASHPTLTRLWTELNTVPAWVDPAQLARGQEVFYRYAGPAVVGLTFQSLLGGMGGYRVVETLSRTGGFGVRVARRRLLETFQHILLVTRDTASLAPGSGDGWVSSVKVRFLHASVRRRILQLAGRRRRRRQSGETGGEGGGRRYYDVSRHGVPVNDLDSIGTIAAFSATLIWVSFPRQGIYLTAREREDYVALWRYVGYLLGAPTDPFFASASRARATMESLMMTEIDPTPTSRVLANNIIAALADAPPRWASEEFLRAETRWLNGSGLSDALHVPKPGMLYTLMVGVQCVFFMAVCYASRTVPAWDRRRIAGLKGRMRRLTVALAGGEAGHEFKYVPGLGVNTAREECGEDGVGARGVPTVERRNVKGLVVAGAAAGVAWLVLRYALRTLQRV